MTTIRHASSKVDDPPILLALYEALEASIEAEDAAFWQIASVTPAQEREEKRAAMKAVYNLALYHWVNDWLGEQQLEAHIGPRESVVTLQKHERLYICGYEDFAEAIKKVANGPGEGLSPNYREFLIFMAGVCVTVQSEMMETV